MPSELYRCPCGYTYRVVRRSERRKRGHVKTMWCPLCRARRPMVKL